MKKEKVFEYEPTSLMVKVDPKTTMISIEKRDVGTDVYQLIREDNLYRRQQCEELNFNDPSYQTYITQHMIDMANNELKHFNDQCVIGVLEKIQRGIQRKLHSLNLPIVLYQDNFSICDSYNTCNSSYLGAIGQTYKYDNVRLLYSMLASDIKTNDEDSIGFRVRAVMDTHAESATSDLYNYLVKRIYSILGTTLVINQLPDNSILDIVEEIVSDAMIDFHDIYALGLVDLLLRFQISYGFIIGKELPHPF